jgi:hypothetical protein
MHPCSTLNEFIKAMHDKGLHTAIVAWREEWAPHTTVSGVTHGDVVFGSLRELTVLAYHKPQGQVLRLELQGAEADRSAVVATLRAAGLRVEERKRNLT